MLLVDEVLQLWGLVGPYVIGGGGKRLALRVLGVEYGWFSGDVARKRHFFFVFFDFECYCCVGVGFMGSCLCVCRLGRHGWLCWVLRMGYFVPPLVARLV